LTAHFEGESYRNRNVEDAYATLEALHYEGEKRIHFEKFVEKHNETYLELERYGEPPVLEMEKVWDFIRQINSPELTAAVQQVKANPILLEDFQQRVNFIALNVTPVKTPQRNIGAITQGQNQPQGPPKFFTDQAKGYFDFIWHTIICFFYHEPIAIQWKHF
jgi:hypothetical protein